jgi:hypothetical protein
LPRSRWLPCSSRTLAPTFPRRRRRRGLKRVPYVQLVKISKEIPGYRFYLFQRLGINGTPTVEELKLSTDKPVPVPSSSSASVWTGVLVLPEKMAAELKTNDNVAKLLTRETEAQRPPGLVIHSTNGETHDLPQNDPRTKVENIITISPDDKAGVTFSSAETPAPPSNKSSSDATPPSSTMFAGIALAGAVMTSGLWWFRRK